MIGIKYEVKPDNASKKQSIRWKIWWAFEVGTLYLWRKVKPSLCLD